MKTMKTMTTKMVLMLMLAVVLVSGQRNQKQRCQRMDVAIMLDSSGSIATSPQVSPFRAMRNFVKNMISRLQTGSDSQAVIHFSERSEIVFNFTTFSSKADMYNAIDDILPFNENTDIGQGLRLLREVIFQQRNGDRPGVPNVAIVLTDGRSNVNVQDTLEQAKLLNDSGVTIYTIGVTQEVLLSELQGIASRTEYSFNPPTFLNLNQLPFLNRVFDTICVSDTSPPPCSSSIDLVFILDQSRSITFVDAQFWSRDLLGFVASILRNFRVSQAETRVGLVKFSNNAESPILLNSFNDLDSLVRSIRSLNLTGDQTNIAAGFRVTRTDILNAARGYRPNRVTVAVLITDGESNIEKSQTLPEANLLKAMGVEIFVVGVGTQINRAELETLASQPVNTHLFTANNFPNLDSLWQRLYPHICNATGQARPPTTTPRPACFVLNCEECARSSPNVCQRCVTGYLLSRGICIVQCNVPNCRQCVRPGECGTCNNGYTLVNGACRMQCNVANCLQCVTPNVCGRCANGYDLVNGACRIQCNVPNCRTCSPSNVCVACNNGFSFDNNRNCVGQCNVANCLQCVTPNVCGRCANGYDLVNGACRIQCNVPNCRTCSPSNVCVACNNGFSLDNNGNCIAQCNVANCLQCVTPTVCGRCANGYDLVNGACRIQCNVPNCRTCSPSNVCVACNNGFLLDNNGNCIAQCNVANCLQCVTPNVCGRCANGYDLVNGACRIQCNVPNCRTCSPSNVCVACNNGFSLDNNGNCIAQCNVANCLQCVTPTVCGRCANGFDLVNGLCQRRAQCNVANCLQCVTPTVCGRCANGYDLVNGACRIQCNVPNCRTCSPSNVCVACNNGFSLDNNGNCVAQCNVANCLQCVTPNVCGRCANGYDLVNGACRIQCNVPNCRTCSPSNVCVACNNGFSLDNNGNCVGQCNVANCLQCVTPNVCGRCANGYDLVNGACRIQCNVPNCRTCSPSNVCVACNNGFSFDNNRNCVAQCNVANCLQCVTPNVCGRCANGYDLVNGACRIQCNVPNCRTCSPPNVCVACNNGFSFDNNRNCVGQCNVANCLQCVTPTVCGRCANGYDLVNGACRIQCNVPNCRTCSPSNVCVACNNGFVLNNNGNCVATCQVPNCIVCDSPNVCRTCAANYYLRDPQSCLLCRIPNCDRCTSERVCGQCRSGFSWNFNANPPSCQVNCNVANCVRCTTPNVCVQCRNNYFLDNRSNPPVCTLCPLSNCLQCQSPTFCSQCASGYVWNVNVNPPACTQLCTLANCRVCASPTVCSQCNPSYFWNTNVFPRQCSLCRIANCALCQSDSVCARCINGYIWNQRTQTCQPNCNIVNCQTCQSTTTCQTCVDTFFLNPLRTQCTRCPIANCLDCLSGTVCRTCAQGFFWSPPNCLVCSIPNCQRCSSSNVCALCNPGFYFDQFRRSCISCQVANCDVCTGVGQCSSCISGFVWDGRRCNTVCPNQADVLLVIDNSGLVERTKYQQILQFLAPLFTRSLSASQIRLAVITYSDTAVLQVPFSNNQDFNQLFANISNLPYRGQIADLPAALRLMYSPQMVASLRPNPVIKAAVIVTNGFSHFANSSLREAELVNDRTPFSVTTLTVGSFKDNYVLRKLASYPTQLNNINVLNTGLLQGVAGRLTNFVCNSIDECRPRNPCNNGGQCNDFINYYTCSCSSAWGGRHCNRARCNSPADVVFVLDSSGSIEEMTFNLALRFLQNVTMQLNLSPANNPNIGYRLGFMTFSTAPQIHFYLNSYNSLLSYLRALQVSFDHGRTNTADAIRLARNAMFTPQRGVRSNFPNVIVFITDGQSGNKTSTWIEAMLTRSSNINIITVGVGKDIDIEELRAMATAPYTSNSMVASSFLAINTELNNRLVTALCSDFKQCTTNPCINGVCRDTFGGFECQCPATFTGRYCERACSGVLDLMIVLDSSGSIRSERFKYLENITLSIIEGLEIGASKTRVGVIIYSDTAQLTIRLQDYYVKQDLEMAIKRIAYQGKKTNTASALRLLRDQAFTSFNGGRPNVPKYAIVMTDGNSNIDKPMTVEEAVKCKLAGIRLSTLSFGMFVDEAELNNIASFPKNLHMFNVANSSVISLMPPRILQSTCDNINECSDSPCLNGGRCVNEYGYYYCQCTSSFAGINCGRRCSQPTDIVFVLDFSGSINYLENWYRLLISFTRTTVLGLDIDSDTARVAIVTYATNVSKIIYFDEFIRKKADLLTALDFYHAGGRTNTQGALFSVLNNVLVSNRGHRNFNNLLTSVVVLSDGESNIQAFNTVRAANDLKRRGVRIYSIVVGRDFNVNEMLQISSNSSLYVHRLPTEANVPEVSRRLLDQNCVL